MKKVLSLLVAVLLSWTLFAQTPATQQQAFPSLSVAAFAESISYDSVTVVDVRTAEEYAQGHIDASVNVVWGKDFDAEVRRAALDKSQMLAVYCRSGKRSKMAARSLVAKGYRVVELNEGFMAWQKAGRPVTTD